MPFEEGWFPEEPPFDPLDEETVNTSNSASFLPSSKPAYSRNAKVVKNSDTGSMYLEVLVTLRKVLSSLDLKPTSDCSSMVQTILANPRVLKELTSETLTVYEGVFEVFLHECTSNPDGTLHLEVMPDLPVLDSYAPEVKEELVHIYETKTTTKISGSSLWEGLRENVQRQFVRRTMQKTIGLIDSKATVETLLDSYKKIEPPTARKALTHTRRIKTAREISAERKAVLASRPQMRFSSGYRSLDTAFTGPYEPIGFIAPGEQAVVAGMTGTGKSSFSYGLVTGLAQDLINWGFKDGKLIWYHTEEESADKIAAAGLDEGDRYHHLADNIVVDAIGTSRSRMAEVIYDLIIDAKKQSDDTGRPIDQFLPHICVLDYIQSVTGEKNEDLVKASITTAEFLLRGVQAWNHEEMTKFSGVDFRMYAGMAWPEGMENHRVAVVTFAQLNKQDDRLMSYKPNSKEHPLSDFAIEDDNPDEPIWRDASGGKWLFEVKEGDQRILRQNAISGSSVILKNATIILFLHRSQPYFNKASKGPDGRLHLRDTRARLIPDKTRNGSAMTVIPMDFDVHDVGKSITRARYFDRLGEMAIEKGIISPHESWNEPGDPILPIRPRPRPLGGVLY